MALANCGAQVNAQGRELAEHGTVRFPIACYHDRMAQDVVPWHWHDEWEAAVIERGTAVVSVDGQSYTMKPGEGIFINSSVLHSVWDKGDTDCCLRSVVFHPRLVGAGIESVFWQSYVQPVLSNTGLRCVLFKPGTAWKDEAIGYILTAWTACAEEPAGYELRVRSALSELVFLLGSHCPAEQMRPTEKALRNEGRMKAMLRHIQEHMQEKLTISGIAKSAAISESECLRCFRDMLGTTPIQYVRQLRIQRAAELLESTDLKIAEVGALCGLQEMSYFSKCFRDAKGCTPKEYRQRKQTVQTCECSSVWKSGAQPAP